MDNFRMSPVNNPMAQLASICAMTQETPMVESKLEPKATAHQEEMQALNLSLPITGWPGIHGSPVGVVGVKRAASGIPRPNSSTVQPQLRTTSTTLRRIYPQICAQPTHAAPTSILHLAQLRSSALIPPLIQSVESEIQAAVASIIERRTAAAFAKHAVETTLANKRLELELKAQAAIEQKDLLDALATEMNVLNHELRGHIGAAQYNQLVIPNDNVAKRQKVSKIPNCCEHGRIKSRCKDCGTGYCLHGREKNGCKDCGTGYCKHGRRKGKCKDCGTGQCQHGRCKSICKDCGTGYCQHGRQKHICRDCGTGHCQHGRRKQRCKDCGTGHCLHGRQKHQCKDCGTGHCQHGRQKHQCKDCGTGYTAKKRQKNDVPDGSPNSASFVMPLIAVHPPIAPVIAVQPAVAPVIAAHPPCGPPRPGWPAVAVANASTTAVAPLIAAHPAVATAITADSIAPPQLPESVTAIADYEARQATPP